METGTTNNYGMRIMTESIRMLNEIGVENIAAQIGRVEAYYRGRLAESGLKIRMLGSGAPKTLSGTVSFLYDPARRSRLQEALKEAGIFAAVREYFRVSLHYYNTERQIDRLMEVLERVLG